MKGVIFINGTIGKFELPDGTMSKGVDLVDIISQVNKFRNADEYVAFINSPGGLYDLGYEMYNYLKSLGKPITTIIDKDCASIATVVALAGDAGKRFIIAGSIPMIHNPWVNEQGDANHLSNVVDSLRNAEDDMLSFYSEQTGTSEAGLQPLMQAEAVLNAQQYVDLGFCDKIITQEEANTLGAVASTVNACKRVAIFNHKSTKKIKMSKTKNLSEDIKAFLKGLGITVGGIKALDLTTIDGKKVNIAKDAADPKPDMPQVGDAVTVDGAQAPNAVLTMPDNSVIELDANSAIESIEASQEESQENTGTDPQSKKAWAAAKAKEFADAKIALKNETPAQKAARLEKEKNTSDEVIALKAVVTQLNAEKIALQAKLDTGAADVDALKIQLTALAKQVGSNYKPDEGAQRFGSRNKGTEGTSDIVAHNKAKMDARRAERNK